MEPFDTPRLRLTPSTIPLARLELADRPAFAQMLGASVPDNWPPESAADALPFFLELIEKSPGDLGWFAWYVLEREQGFLIGGCGFKGPPVEGTVETGYSLLPQFMGKGYGTEMIEGLVAWAFRQPGVERVRAETDAGNTASRRLLARLGFQVIGKGVEEGGMMFEKARQ